MNPTRATANIAAKAFWYPLSICSPRLPCPQCERSDAWRLIREISSGTDTYTLVPAGWFSLEDTTCESEATRFECGACGYEIDDDQDRDLDDALRKIPDWACPHGWPVEQEPWPNWDRGRSDIDPSLVLPPVVDVTPRSRGDGHERSV